MRKLSVGVIAAALLLSGGLMGISFAGPGITEPEVIELDLAFCGDPGICRFYSLRDFEGRSGGQITLGRFPLFDIDGTRVGTLHQSCVNSTRTPPVCTFVHGLRAGPYTELGTVVTSGILTFSGDTFAVTGGTGAYANVRGSATLDESGYTLNLIP